MTPYWLLRGMEALNVVEHVAKFVMSNLQRLAAWCGAHCSLVNDAAVHDGTFFERLEAGHNCFPLLIAPSLRCFSCCQPLRLLESFEPRLQKLLARLARLCEAADRCCIRHQLRKELLQAVR